MSNTTFKGRGARLAADAAILLAAIVAVYLPVMLALPLRSTGDEKTYIAQAVEMAGRGDWFRQTLFGEPNYFKGPLFLILLRLGARLFGATAPFALTYMSFFGYVAAALGLLVLVERRLPEARGAGLLAATIVVLSCGGFAHALAAQMEAPLIVAYAAFLALLAGAPRGDRGTGWRVGLWVAAGLAGWLKSPIHSVLLGVSALLYWGWTRELKDYAGRAREWLAAVAGVVVGALGYLPAFILDHEAFVGTYLGRETFAKGGGNEVRVDEALMPFLTAHLLPWLPLLLAAVWVALTARRRRGDPASRAGRDLAAAAACVVIPTVLFFSAYPYRNGVYILPILPAVALLIGLAWWRGRGSRAFSIAWGGAAAIVVVAAVALSAVVLRFAPWPPWWGERSTAVVLAGAVLAILLFVAALRRRDGHGRVVLAVGAVASFFIAVGRIDVALGDHEAYDVRTAALPASPEPWLRLNLTRHLWSETGILNFMLDHPVSGIVSPAALPDALAVGRVFLVPDEEQLAALAGAAAARRDLTLTVRPWRRWRVHGESADGTPAWRTAWASRSLAPLERREYVAIVGPAAGRRTALTGGDQP